MNSPFDQFNIGRKLRIRGNPANVGNDTVLRLKAGKQIYGCHDAWIITTSNFTKEAKEAAEALRIRLINGLTVHDMINRWRKERNAQTTKSRATSGK